MGHPTNTITKYPSHISFLAKGGFRILQSVSNLSGNLVIRCIPRWFAHLSSNQARCVATTLIEASTNVLSQSSTPVKSLNLQHFSKLLVLQMLQILTNSCACIEYKLCIIFTSYL